MPAIDDQPAMPLVFWRGLQPIRIATNEQSDSVARSLYSNNPQGVPGVLPAQANLLSRKDSDTALPYLALACRCDNQQSFSSPLLAEQYHSHIYLRGIVCSDISNGKNLKTFHVVVSDWQERLFRGK
jgi:hypothetical protein